VIEPSASDKKRPTHLLSNRRKDIVHEPVSSRTQHHALPGVPMQPNFWRLVSQLRAKTRSSRSGPLHRGSRGSRNERTEGPHPEVPARRWTLPACWPLRARPTRRTSALARTPRRVPTQLRLVHGELSRLTLRSGGVPPGLLNREPRVSWQNGDTWREFTYHHGGNSTRPATERHTPLTRSPPTTAVSADQLRQTDRWSEHVRSGRRSQLLRDPRRASKH